MEKAQREMLTAAGQLQENVVPIKKSGKNRIEDTLPNLYILCHN